MLRMGYWPCAFRLLFSGCAEDDFESSMRRGGISRIRSLGERQCRSCHTSDLPILQRLPRWSFASLCLYCFTSPKLMLRRRLGRTSIRPARLSRCLRNIWNQHATEMSSTSPELKQTEPHRSNLRLDVHSTPYPVSIKPASPIVRHSIVMATGAVVAIRGLGLPSTHLTPPVCVMTNAGLPVECTHAAATVSLRLSCPVSWDPLDSGLRPTRRPHSSHSMPHPQQRNLTVRN